MGDFWTLTDIDDDAPALIVPGSVTVTYGMLLAASEAWRVQLCDIARGEVPLVALEFATTYDAIAAYIGVLRAGLPLLIVEPGKLGGDDQLERVWRPDLRLVAGPDYQTVLSERPGWREDVASLPAPHPDLRMLLSTSGSTGEPKLVRLSGRNIAANADSIAEYLALRPSDRAATSLPLFYSYGLSVLNSYLGVGAALVLIPQSITDPTFWEVARASGVTSLAFVPHQFDLLRGTGFDGTELPSLRYMTQAGGRLDPGAVRHFWELGHGAGWQLFVMYGQTEASPRISYVPPEELPDAGDTIGRAIPGGRLWVVDDQGCEVREPGQAGELVYQGPNVMMGYALTRLDLAGGSELKELRTGDVAECTAGGNFRIVGRMKRFVKLYGLRLSLDQIEAFLYRRGIEANAVGVEDELVILCRDAGEQQAARVAIAEKVDLPATHIHTDHLRELPLLPSGKTDDQALRRFAAGVVERSRGADRVARGNAGILEVIRGATRLSEVRSSDSFVSLGGDSLSYLQVQIALDERLGAAPSGWERMTVAELDALIRERDQTGRMERPRVSVGFDVILRLLAIGIIVFQHASSFPLFGGAWILLAVMGFSAARFQVHHVAAGRSVRLLNRMLYPIIPLYFVVLMLYAAFRDDVPLRYWVLLGNYEPWTGGSLLVVYWFVSAYTQIVVVLALVAALPPARRTVSVHPWRAAALLSATLLVVLVALGFQHQSDDLPYVPQRGLIECLSVFAIGWMLRRMEGVRQTTVTALLAAAVLSALIVLDMTPQTLAIVVIALALLAVKRDLRLRREWARALNQLAALTLYVYLVHQVVIFLLSSFGLPQAVASVLALCLSFAVAAGMKRGIDALDRATRARRRTTLAADGALL